MPILELLRPQEPSSVLTRHERCNTCSKISAGLSLESEHSLDPLSGNIFAHFKRWTSANDD